MGKTCRGIAASASLAVLVSAVLLSGCATPIANRSASEIASSVERADSTFDARISFVGPEVFEAKPRGLLSDHQRYRLRAWRDKNSGAVTYQLYVRIWFNTGSWRRYQSASFENALQVDLVRVDTDVKCMSGGGYTSCSHEEIVGVPLTGEFLASKASTGFTVRLNSQAGVQSFITVSPSYLQGFLQVVGR